jgi:outer membrane receptor for ferrienterochelin and colicins
MMRKLLFYLLLLGFTPLLAQPMPVDSLWHVDMPEYIVTATRSGRHLSQVTVPTLLVHARAIRMAGHLRLNEVLQEQTGLFLTAGAGSSAVGGGIFGNGVQIQGFAPDYTLILLDGEPLIGRQGGVIDLTRFAVGNIRKLEIIKGPSSALYGSEAMGGVINILTEQRRQSYASGGLRFGQFGTADLNATANINGERSTLYLFGNFNRSDGYDLQPERPEQTLDPYHNASFQLKWTYRFSDRTQLIWSNRLFHGVQDSEFALNSPTINVQGQGRTTDLNINPTINHLIHDRLKTSMRLYSSLFRYEQYLDLKGSEEPYYTDDFQHAFYRMENQTDWDWADGQQLVVGGGYNLQQVQTMRYRTDQSQHIAYAFLQNEWRPNERWILIPGLRYDLHSDYANQLTPKLSMQYRAHDRLHFNFSYGSGFKAPDFRQLYLYYVNPAAQGYRVYGASEFSIAELEQQMEEGLVARILPEAYQISELRPELSHGFNLGGNYAFRAVPLKADLNFFYNTIRDLINYIPVATLQSNALVFSYLNINRAFTGGMEINLSGTIRRDLEWGVGYQYLLTGDRDVLRRMRDGEVFGRNSPQGAARRMDRSDYTGLLGRSPHMLNIRLLYEHPRNGWGGTLRAIYRSRWGVVDLDGNGFANMPEEFARGFTMLNASIQKSISRKITAQFNVNNMLNHIDAVNTPHLPGVHVLGAIHWNFLN